MVTGTPLCSVGPRNKKGKCSSPYVNQSLHIIREMVSQNGVAMHVSESIPDFSDGKNVAKTQIKHTRGGESQLSTPGVAKAKKIMVWVGSSTPGGQGQTKTSRQTPLRNAL